LVLIVSPRPHPPRAPHRRRRFRLRRSAQPRRSALRSRPRRHQGSFRRRPMAQLTEGTWSACVLPRLVVTARAAATAAASTGTKSGADADPNDDADADADADAVADADCGGDLGALASLLSLLGGFTPSPAAAAAAADVASLTDPTASASAAGVGSSDGGSAMFSRLLPPGARVYVTLTGAGSGAGAGAGAGLAYPLSLPSSLTHRPGPAGPSIATTRGGAGPAVAAVVHSVDWAARAVRVRLEHAPAAATPGASAFVAASVSFVVTPADFAGSDTTGAHNSGGSLVATLPVGPDCPALLFPSPLPPRDSDTSSYSAAATAAATATAAAPTTRSDAVVELARPWLPPAARAVPALTSLAAPSSAAAAAAVAGGTHGSGDNAAGAHASVGPSLDGAAMGLTTFPLAAVLRWPDTEAAVAFATLLASAVAAEDAVKGAKPSSMAAPQEALLSAFASHAARISTASTAAAAAIAAVSSSSSVASAPSYSSVCPRCGLHPSAVLSHGSVLNLQRGYLHRCFCVPAPVPPVEQQRTMYLVLDSCNRKGIVAKVAMAGRPNQPVEGFILADAPDTLKKYYKQQQATFPSDRSPSPSSSLPSVFPGVPGVLCMSSVWLGRPLSASVHTRELQHLLGRSEELLMLGYHSIHYDQLGQVFKVFNEQQIHNIATAAEAEAEAPGETHH